MQGPDTNIEKPVVTTPTTNPKQSNRSLIGEVVAAIVFFMLGVILTYMYIAVIQKRDENDPSIVPSPAPTLTVVPTSVISSVVPSVDVPSPKQSFEYPIFIIMTSTKDAAVLVSGEVNSSVEIIPEESEQQASLTLRGENFVFSISDFYESNTSHYQDYSTIDNVELGDLVRYKSEAVDSKEIWRYTKQSDFKTSNCQSYGQPIDSPCGADFFVDQNYGIKWIQCLPENTQGLLECDEIASTLSFRKPD